MLELSSRDEKLIRFACRIYGGLLLAYPRDFRRRYRHEMTIVFRDRCREAMQSGKQAAFLGHAAHSAIDLIKSAFLERSTCMSNMAVLAIVTAFAGGLFAAYVDFHNMEVQAPMLVILVGSFIAGAIYPRLGWLWALIVAACLTASHIIAPRFGLHPIDAGHLGNPLLLMFVALPAAVSAYAGAGARWLLGQATAFRRP